MHICARVCKNVFFWSLVFKYHLLKTFVCFVSESTDESEADKIHCLNNSVSSGTYSDYSPSQASSGSSNAHVKLGSLQPTAKEAVNNSLWGNRCDHLS